MRYEEKQVIFRAVIKNLGIDWKSRKTEVTLQIDATPQDIEKMSGKDLSVELKQYREKRSLDANAYYWLLVGKLAQVLNQTNQFIHNDMLRKYGEIEIIDGKPIYIVLPDTETAEEKANEADTYHIKPTSQVKIGNDGRMYRTYMMLRGSSDYDTKEMSRLINGLAEECQNLGIETMTSEQMERMMVLYEKHHAKR